MPHSRHSDVARLVKQVRRTWAELDYAQRRLLEIRTGVPDPGSRAVARDRPRIAA